MLKSIIMSAVVAWAMFAGAENRIYQGQYATGIAKWTFNATNEIPDALLVFLATQILVGESTTEVEPPPAVDPTPVVSPTPAVDPIPAVDPTPVIDPTPVVDPTPTVAPEPSQPSQPTPVVDLSLWQRARTLHGALEANGRISAVVEVKCGKMDRRGIARISAKVTPLDGSKRSYRAQRIQVRRQATQSVVWNGLRLDIAGNEIAGKESSSSIRNAAVGGDFRDGTYVFSAVCGAVPPAEKGYAVLPELFPTTRSFTIARNKWKFPKAKDDPAAIKISYNVKTGIFKGSFKAILSNEGYTTGRIRTKKASVKVMGFVVDGKGEGKATAKKPVLTFQVGVGN